MKIIVPSGANIIITGDYTNTTTGSDHGEIDIDGTIKLTGDFTNNADDGNNVFVNRNTDGTVKLSGNSQQTIGGTEETIFENLTLDNSNGVNAAILDVANNVVESVFSLTDGGLDLNSNTLIVDNSATGAVTYTDGYIKSVAEDKSFLGNLQWNIGATAGEHIFQFSVDGTNDLTFIFDLNSGDAGNVSVSMYPSDGADAAGVYADKPTDVTNLESDDLPGNPGNAANIVKRFWGISLSGETAPDVDVTFMYAESEIPVSGEQANQMRAQKYNDATDIWYNAMEGQTSNTTTNTVLVPGVTSFSKWAISKDEAQLPIVLLNFTARWDNEKKSKALLNWITASEINNDYYEIQRTTELSASKEINTSIIWETIATVFGAGNSNKRLNYEYLDDETEQVLSPIFYYRLKQVDYDGKYTFSNIVALSKENEIFDLISIYPNPVGESNTIQLYSVAIEETIILIQVIDDIGKCVLFKEEKLNKGENYFEINIANLPRATYFVNAMTKSGLSQTSRLFLR